MNIINGNRVLPLELLCVRLMFVGGILVAAWTWYSSLVSPQHLAQSYRSNEMNPWSILGRWPEDDGQWSKDDGKAV